MSTDRITLHGGGRTMQLAVVIAALTVAVFAFAAGAPALIAALVVAGLPPWLAIAAPVVVDAAMIVAAAALVVRRSQGRKTSVESTTLVGLVVLSAGVQLLHAWVETEGQSLAVRIPAIAVATALPLLVLAGTELAGRAVLVEKATKRNRPARPIAKDVATASQPIVKATPRPIAPPPSITSAPIMTLAEAATAFAAGTLSQRKAAAAAGVTVDAVRKAAAPLRDVAA